VENPVFHTSNNRKSSKNRVLGVENYVENVKKPFT